jgi:hypothetical protein
VIPTSIAIAQGSYIGVLGCCTPTVGSTTSSNSYGTPPGPFTSNILGSPVTLTRLGTQFASAQVATVLASRKRPTRLGASRSTLHPRPGMRM